MGSQIFWKPFQSDIYENHLLLTDAQKVSDIIIGENDIVGGTFDENGEIEIIKTWEELGVEAIYHADGLILGGLIEFTTTIKPLNPNIAITENGPEIFLGRVLKLISRCIPQFYINWIRVIFELEWNWA